MLINIIVLLLEVLYYSLFMTFTRKEGKFHKYFIAFMIITALGIFINMRNLISYLILVLLILLAMKYIVRIKTSLFDMFIIILMLFISLAIELLIYVLMYKLIGLNHFAVALTFQLVKVGIVLLNRNTLEIMYIKLKQMWDNNNFYVRYIFSVLVYFYVIIVSVLLLLKVWR